jgi:hypothetical protein
MTQRCLRLAVLVAIVGAAPVACGNNTAEITRSPIRINELSPQNGVYQDLFGNAGDWIELYNGSDKDFDLGGYYISNHVKKRFEYQFPEGAADAGDAAQVYTVPAKGVLLMFADAQPLESSPTEPHLSFKLSAKGSGVWLSDPAGYLVDWVQFSVLPPNSAGTTRTSLARFPDGIGEFQWCTKSSPSELNGDHCTGEIL